MIREHDMFGHVINLNFDRRGDAHKTVCGGVFSLFFKTFLAGYVYLMLYKLISKGNDTNLGYEGQIRLEELGEIDYSVTRMRVFYVIRKQADPSLLKKIEDADGYFEMNVVQQLEDYYKSEFTKKATPMRTCTQEDFGTSEKSKELFSAWKGFLIVCPDISKDNTYTLFGDKSSMVSKSIGVQFKMCDGVGCKSDRQ